MMMPFSEWNLVQIYTGRAIDHFGRRCSAGTMNIIKQLAPEVIYCMLSILKIIFIRCFLHNRQL